MNDKMASYRDRKAYILCDLLTSTFPDLTLTACDVGADFFKNRMNWHHFEPTRLTVHVFDIDKAFNTAAGEIDHLGVTWQFYPYAVAEKDGPVPVFLPENPINGSCFLPNEDALQWGAYDGHPWTIYPVERSVELPGISLDSWKRQFDIGCVDVLKMNIQGAELAALRGGLSVLDDVLALEIEMSFSQTYLLAPLFSDIDPFIRQHALEFFDLIGPNICSHLQTPIRFGESRDLRAWGFPRHKLFEGHFLYFRDPLALRANRDLPAERIIKLACIAEVYGHSEYAFALLNWLAGQRPEFKDILGRVLADGAAIYRQAFSR